MKQAFLTAMTTYVRIYLYFCAYASVIIIAYVWMVDCRSDYYMQQIASYDLLMIVCSLTCASK